MQRDELESLVTWLGAIAEPLRLADVAARICEAARAQTGAAHAELDFGGARFGSPLDPAGERLEVKLARDERAFGALAVAGGADSPEARAKLEWLARHALAQLLKAQAYERALDDAARDPLTRLWNRAAFWSRLENETERARRYARPMALVIFDVDGFRDWNRSRGHLDCDGALVRVAEALASGARASDAAGRLGGDELALLLPETGCEGAITAANKVLFAAAQAAARDGGPEATLSAGIACVPDDGTSAEALTRVADRRLYAAKLAGGNRSHASD